MQKDQIRQGDLLLLEIPSPTLPAEHHIVSENTDEPIVLLQDGASGHIHQVIAALHLLVEAKVAETNTQANGTQIKLWQKFLHLPEGGELTHEEHGTIYLNEGWYQVQTQRVFEPRARIHMPSVD